MSKQKRVYELARDFKVSSQAMIDVLKNLGFEIRSHMSPVNEDMHEDVTSYFEGQKAEAKAEDSRKKEVAEKRKAIEEAKKEVAKAERDSRVAEKKAEKEAKDAEEKRVRKKLEEEAAKRVAEKLTRAKSETERLKKQAAEAKKRAEEARSKKAETEDEGEDEKLTKAAAMAEEARAEAEEAEAETAEAEEEVAEAEEAEETAGAAEAGEEEEPAEKAADEKAGTEEPSRPEQRRRGGRLSGASLRERIKQSKEARETEGAGPKIIERRAPQPKERRPSKPAAKKESGKKKRKKGRKKVDQDEVQATIKETLADLRSGKSKSRRRRRDTSDDEQTVREAAEEQKVIRVAEFASVSELASTMGVKPNEIIGACFQLGLVVTINQRLDMETIEFIADEFGYEIEEIEEYGADAFEEPEQEVSEEEMRHRAPVVTVMGHVDHGKTSLLDYIRATTVVAGEVGGITQHIGAYEVQTESGPVTFLDTPGHEAFTAMRARGAQLTDIVVLVIAADDKVMPQTVEAINHARAAGVPIVVAINKVDRPDADPSGVKQQLTQHNVIVEDFGGDVVAVPVSAKTGENVDKLLEMILLQADLLELKADPTGHAKGTVVEAQLDRGRGPVATILVEKGTLEEGDPFLCGLHSGRVRAMMDERGNRVEEAGPSQPVAVVGFDGLPQPGDQFYAVADEKEARDLSQKRQQIKREQEFAVREATSLSDVRARVESGELNELPIIVKGDTDGSVEALSDSLHKLSTEEVQVKVIHQGVGGITESDVLLAQTSDAIVVGFHVRPDRNAREAAEQMGVDIRLYEIIYEAVEEIKKGLEGLLKPEVKEEVLGTLEVRDTFRIPKAGTIAGCYVTEGLIRRNARVRLVRDGVVTYDGKVDSLKRFKDDAREVKEGFECGVGLENFNDIKVGDLIEVYEEQEIARTL